MIPARRLATAAGLWVLLVAPAPGAVGSCDAEDVAADPYDFCYEINGLKIQRDDAAGRITEAEARARLAMLDTTCRAFAWPADCVPPPTRLEQRACADALSDVSRLHEPSDAIAECQDLCGE
ncbi:MAG: hypothetical protein NZ898_03525 [Myxococcota bacterium]|nr:hypothetical protein [Myxococcota bacterium]MDW8361178.1 hypothetical protein [Myxococcales bacterium]